MASADRSIRVYQELATHYDARGEPQVRDRFLVLAADAATAAGRPEEAERLRNRLLQLNPHHMLKPYSSWSQALQSPDVTSYIEGLRRTYPPASAENLLASVRGSNEEERMPQPLPSAALEATLPYAPDTKTTAANPPLVKPSAAPSAKEAPASIPTAPVVRTVRMPVVPVAVPVTTGFAVAAPSPAQGAPMSEGLAQDTRRGKPSGSWFSILLFYLVLLAGVALGAYTFVRPFCPLSGTTPHAETRELKSQAAMP